MSRDFRPCFSVEYKNKNFLLKKQSSHADAALNIYTQNRKSYSYTQCKDDYVKKCSLKLVSIRVYVSIALIQLIYRLKDDVTSY